MPLLDGKAHTLSTATPLSFRPDEQVFVLQTTGEIVSDFQRYTELHKLYRCKKWASITGKTGLTFAEAAKEEEKNKSLAEKFPPEIVDDAIHMVHHSPLRVEELITSIQDKFNPYGKRAYEPGNKHSVSKVVVKAWLQEVAEQQEVASGLVWSARPDVLRQYSLPTEVPQSVLDWLAAPPPPPLPVPTKGKRSSRSAGARPEKRARTETEAPAQNKRAAHPPYARGGYNSEEWVFDDDDEDEEMPPEQPDEAGGEDDGMADADGDLQDNGIRSLEEEEERFRPGTNKAVSLQVLKDAGTQGMSLGDIMEVSQARGLKEWEPGAKRILQFALSNDAAFVRVRKGVYALRALAGNVGPMPHNTPKSSRPPRYEYRDSYREGSAGSDLGSRASFRDDDIARAEYEVDAARQAVGDLMRQIEQAEAEVDSLMEQVSQAESKIRSPFKRRAGPTEEEIAEMPDFQVPASQAEYTGDPANKKDQMAHRKQLAQLELQMQCKKDEWIREQIQRRHSGQADVHAREVAELREKLQEGQDELDSTRRDLAAAEKQAAEAERALHREYNRADSSNNRRGDRNDGRSRLYERDERDRRRLDAIHAKRYPVDDLELIAEHRHGKRSADIPLPPLYPRDQSDHVATMLYIVDFLSQFSKVLAMKPISFQDFCQSLYSTAAASTPPNAAPSAASDTHANAAPNAQTGDAANVQASAAGFSDLAAPSAVVNGTADLADAVSGIANGVATNGLLAGAAADLQAEDGDSTVLFDIYRGLLQFLLQGSPSPIEYRWAVLNTAGTWPEILRRYVMSRSIATMLHPLVSAKVSSTAAMLASKCAQLLTADQHLVLLRYLCDEALDTEALREALSQRVDGAEEVKKEMREDMAEDKRKLKELAEAEKEERKLRRDGDSRKVKLEEEAGSSAAAADVDGSIALDTQPSGLDERTNSRAGSSGMGEGDEEEQDAEQPAEVPQAPLPERRPSRHAAERQRQAAVRAQSADTTRRKGKSREAKDRAAADAEKAKAAERAEAEDVLSKRQEVYERELEKYAVRRYPLGMDRHHRCYWWGVAGQRCLIYVEDFEGRVGVMTKVQDLEAVADSLDRRGIRELALATAIDKCYISISQAMQTGSSGVEAAAPAPPQPPVLRQSSRQHQSSDGISPAKEALKLHCVAARVLASPTLPLMEGIEGAALAAAVDALLVTQQAAERAGIAGPPQGWAPWGAAVTQAGQGRLDNRQAATDTSGDLVGQMSTFLKASVQECEECVFVASGQADAPEEPESADTVRPWMKELPKIRKEDRCGYCHTCLNPHLKKPCKTRRDEMMAMAAGPMAAVKDSGDQGEGGSGNEQQEKEQAWEGMEPLGGAAAGNYGKLWRNTRERTVWRNDIAQANTASRVAYCILLFAELAAPVIDVLNPDIVVKVPKGKRAKRR